jgi:superfamily II DNA/RNA helicase
MEHTNYTKSIDYIYENNSIEQSIIFLDKEEDVKSLFHLLYEKDYPINYYYENMSLREKTQVIEYFLSGNSRVIICSENTEDELFKMLININMDINRISHILRMNNSPKNLYDLFIVSSLPKKYKK